MMHLYPIQQIDLIQQTAMILAVDKGPSPSNKEPKIEMVGYSWKKGAI